MIARNIEIKARARDFQKQSRIAESLSSGRIEHLVQEDTFFKVPTGRLKLREFRDGTGELIQYHRNDSYEPTESCYVRSATSDPTTLKEALSNALGIRGVVSKQRTVYLVDRTRIHLDQVEGLGQFIELEVVIPSQEQVQKGVTIANKLMRKLDILESDLMKSAYVDLLGW